MSLADAYGIYTPPDPPQPEAPTYDNANNITAEAAAMATPPPLPDIPFRKMTTTFDAQGVAHHSVVDMTQDFFNKASNGIQATEQIKQVAPVIEKALQDKNSLIDSLQSQLSLMNSYQKGALETARRGSEAAAGYYGDAINGLRAKRDLLVGNPLLAGIGRIASAAAAEYAGGPGASRISPLVHAAGAYGLDTFGQSPDNLNQQIAGLSSQAQAAQLPYASLIEKSYGQTLGALEAEQKQQELQQNKADALALAKTKAVSSVVEKFTGLASKVSTDPADPATAGLIGTYAEGAAKEVLAAGGSKDQAKEAKRTIGAIATLNGLSVSKAEKAKEDRATAANQLGYDRIEASNNRMAASINAANERLKMTQEFGWQKDALNRLDIPAKSAPAAKAVADLAGYKTVNDMLDTVEKRIANNLDKVGPIAGRFTRLSEALGTNTSEGAALYHDFKQLLLVQGKYYGGGQALLRKYGLEQVKDLKPDLQMNTAQIKGLLQAIRETGTNSYLTTSATLNKAQVNARRQLYPNDAIFKAALNKAIDPQSEVSVDLHTVKGINPDAWYPQAAQPDPDPLGILPKKK